MLHWEIIARWLFCNETTLGCTETTNEKLLTALSEFILLEIHVSISVESTFEANKDFKSS